MPREITGWGPVRLLLILNCYCYYYYYNDEEEDDDVRFGIWSMTDAKLK